ncbi:hypothetical protein [Qipengyuania seohaensis]|uniref:hypothetical protein n=1 Tax=Qipengyuania seohaensis TaxID=266951 RepID=UPI0012FDB085|nr:hypothetical protein [Qipengyuania seohaensis]
MKSLLAPLLLASAMLGAALLGSAGLIAKEIAQTLPFLVLAVSSPAWLRGDRSCNLLKGASR